VGRNTRPAEETAVARTLVPPMSTPMKRGTGLFDQTDRVPDD
jgi:hypothetical protein